MSYLVIINITIIINSHAKVIAVTVHNTYRKLCTRQFPAIMKQDFSITKLCGFAVFIIYQLWRNMYKFQNIKD